MKLSRLLKLDLALVLWLTGFTMPAQANMEQADALNRVLTATYTKSPATPLSIAYTYDQGTDGIGHLTGITEPTGTTAYGYDQHGRLTSELRTAHGMTYTTTYAYDSQGRLASVGYPSGRLISYTFDSVGRVNQVSGTFNSVTTILASNIAYAPFGGVKSFSFGDGVTAPVQTYARTFDQDGRISSFTLNGNANTVGYDVASQITTLINPLYPTIPAAYGYDSLSRLTSYIQNTTSQSYGYDADGNRTTQTLGSTTTYTYPTTSNRLTGIVHGGTTAITEDANGSITNDFDRQYTYDLRGRLIQTTTTLGNVNYEVNAQGLRVRKQAAYTGGADTMFFYDQGGHLIGEAPTGGTTFAKEYVYFGDIPLAVTNGTGGFNYVHTDHLGTPRVITNTAGQVVWQWDNLDPFGNNAPNENPAGLGVYHFDIGSAGQYRDRETNTVYNINRNLNTATGRYNESDLIGLAGGINTYGNVGGNPLSFVDPLGLYESSPWLRAIVPGQVAFDNAVTALQAGNFGWAATNTAAMLGEMALSVASMGTSQTARTAGQCAAKEVGASAEQFFRGAKQGGSPNFIPRIGEFKVNPTTGTVLPTHGVSVFNNAESVLSKGYIPHELDLSSISSELQIIQRGKDITHFEIVPTPGANLTPGQFTKALCLICIK